MSVIFLKKRSRQKKRKFFIFLKGRYFVMGGPIDMNIGVFWETFVGFLKSLVLQLFPKYSHVMSIWMSKVEQNFAAFKK